MMSVLIKGMEMPESCSVCKLSTRTHHGEIICKLLNMYASDSQREYECPLVEVPPHGRLIDADEFGKALEMAETHARDRGFSENARKFEIFRYRLGKETTVIPADKED